MPVFFSLSARLLVNLEALNMAENVGNVVRHRRAPVVLRTDQGFVLRYVPVISGESLAHHYQRLLAEIAKQRNIPVCNACSQGIFLKHSNEEVFRKYDKKEYAVFENAAQVEEYVVKNCVIEDVGGFLVAAKEKKSKAKNAKRTSRFRIGYMIPALDALEAGAAATEAQFHVRYSPEAGQRRDEEETTQQAIYYVEIGSAVYVFNFALDATGVGARSMENEGASGKDPYILPLEERFRRVEAAFDALAAFLGGMAWGAKISRFQPHWKILSLVAAVTEPIPFNVSPGHGRDYLAETVSRACSLAKIVDGFKAAVYYYDAEGLAEAIRCDNVKVEKHKNYLETVEKAKQETLERLS
ncbi:CRISPR-associated protein, Csa2 family [Pyrodictium delaneyi]|uniref:CRISPR-associated protein, Csa2 family n=1 Tax=Pyrodictium delaneyi TaxID=1273541 RepID=A0A0P0N235_9CREN|nr:type I-A CRISPR-associated protein Cas7/Csa2 [Pyrodictium delaneyi]ALL00357.1 CRISPR-associated protein, Csa2 family [Pyrodictium delaneyi]